jgi:hypothetical protein
MLQSKKCKTKLILKQNAHKLLSNIIFFYKRMNQSNQRECTKFNNLLENTVYDNISMS